MNLGKQFFDYDVKRLELCELEIRRKGEYICESNQIEKLNHLHKIIINSGCKMKNYSTIPEILQNN
jgi:hypothetical protein